MKTKKPKSKVRLKKVKSVKEPKVKVKELYKNKKKLTSKLTSERLGIEYFFEVVKSDKEGNPIITRSSKYNKGKLVKEMVYNYSKDEAEYKVKEI